MRTSKLAAFKMRRSRPQWFGDEDEAALIDVRSGLVLGGFSHDGYGKYEIWLYASPWRSCWVLLNAPGGVAAWAPFPRVCLWLVRLKDLAQAIAEIEYLSGVGPVRITRGCRFSLARILGNCRIKSQIRRRASHAR